VAGQGRPGARGRIGPTSSKPLRSMSKAHRGSPAEAGETSQDETGEALGRLEAVTGAPAGPATSAPGGPTTGAPEAPAPPREERRRRRFLYAIGGLGVSPARARVVLTLGGPVLVGMVTQSAVNLVDTAMVGRLPAAVSIPGQAALGLALPLYWVIGGFLAAIQIGTQAIVARRFGEGNKDLAGRALMNSLLLGSLSAIVLSIAAIFLVPVVFPFFHSDPEVIRWGVPYLQIRLVGTLAMVTTLSSKAFFDGIGRTYVHMVAALLMNVLNIFGNWLFIFGNLGAPELMVTGAALASAVSTYLGMAIMLAWTLGRELRTDYAPYRWRNRNPEVMWNIVRISVPSGVATVAMMSGFLMFMKFVGALDADAGHGAVYTAASKVVLDIKLVTFMACIAFGTATATLVGQSLGRGKPRRAELFGWESVKMASYLFAGVGLVTFLWPQIPLQVFSKDPEVIAAGIPVLRLLASVQGLMAASLILMQANFGAGNSKFVMKVELVLHFFCLVPLAWVLGVALDYGLMGMWSAVVVYTVILALVMGYKFYEGRWKDVEV
jgi:multidrug resistance protein, MATE family